MNERRNDRLNRAEAALVRSMTTAELLAIAPGPPPEWVKQCTDTELVAIVETGNGPARFAGLPGTEG